jgi:hypothetical protein
MSQKEYRLFSAEQTVDGGAMNKWLYLTRRFENYAQRVYLLNSGELALVDYVDYGDYTVPQEVLAGKTVGKGVSHYYLRELKSFDSFTEIFKHPILLKSKIINMSQVLVRRNSYTGYYELVQGKDIDDIFEAAKA